MIYNLNYHLSTSVELHFEAVIKMEKYTLQTKNPVPPLQSKTMRIFFESIVTVVCHEAREMCTNVVFYYDVILDFKNYYQ